MNPVFDEMMAGSSLGRTVIKIADLED